MRKSFPLFLVICLFVYLRISFPANAQQTPTVSVVPSIIQLDLATDKPQANVLYRNNSSQTVEITLSASDFTELEDGYKISYLNKKDAQNYKYSLSSWIDFSSRNIVIEPFQTVSVIVFVSPDKLSPGGHYGTILAQIETQKDASKNVQIQGILSSLLFVRTHTGKEIEKGNIQTFSPLRNMFDFPESMILRFNNSGDTTLTPYGLITVTDMFGNYVTKGILNIDSSLTLPETIRRYEVPLRPTAFLLPQVYTATITLQYGKSKTVITQKSIFFSQGSIPLISILIVLIGAIAVIFIRVKTIAARKKMQ